MKKFFNNLTMHQFNNLERVIGLLIVLFAVGFNLWIYRLEPSAKVDPNDNTFQYALVDRTNQIWDFAQQKCSGVAKPFCMLTYLTDHWVPNWAQGYNLPYYYSHVPQVLIVASWRLFSLFSIHCSLFTYYHWVIYLLLCLFPVSVFFALRLVGLSWITAGFGALIASHLSTDGLYGLDPASFLWRGYGLSSQLFAMIWLPLALAYAYKYFDIRNTTSDTRNGLRNPHTEFRITNYGLRITQLIPSIFFLAATTAGHLGIGIIAFLSIAVLWISPVVQLILSSPEEIVKLLYCYIAGKPSELKQQFNSLTIQQIQKLLVLFGGVFLLLGYWIFPILLYGNYHNISVWDGIWKFDSFGYREVLKNLFNGDLFDFGRSPILTFLVFIGFFSALHKTQPTDAEQIKKQTSRIHNNATIKQYNNDKNHLEEIDHPSYFPFALLFAFWLVLYFGRTTWGGLIDLIPGMNEFHLSRFIVGVHIAGLFLIPIGLHLIFQQFSNLAIQQSGQIFKLLNGYIVKIAIIVGLILLVFPQTLRYAAHNDFLIKRGNEDYARDQSDIAVLLSTINHELVTKPGRVFAGRGGSWGKSFRIAETPMYMHLSTYGIPVILWLPETWSPNSDTEQYFSEGNPALYSLYNVRYVVTPANLTSDQIQPFWKPLTSGKTWKLYSVVIPAPEPGSTEKNAWIPGRAGNDNALGYIATGIRPAIVSTTKENYRSLIRLWMHGDYLQQQLYPELTFDPDYPKQTGLPNFRMLDEVTYKVPAGTTHNLFSSVPIYVSPLSDVGIISDLNITSQSQDSDMAYSATVVVPPNCTECLVILKQSFHPSWRATIDGKPVQTMTVFPFYIGASVPEGAHTVVFSYEPSSLKKFLLVISLITLISLLWVACQYALRNFKARL